MRRQRDYSSGSAKWGEGLFKDATERMASRFDTVELDAGDRAGKWPGVRRMKTNFDQPMSFFRHETCFAKLQHDISIARTGMAASNEEVADREFWADEEA